MSVKQEKILQIFKIVYSSIGIFSFAILCIGVYWQIYYLVEQDMDLIQYWFVHTRSFAAKPVLFLCFSIGICGIPNILIARFLSREEPQRYKKAITVLFLLGLPLQFYTFGLLYPVSIATSFTYIIIFVLMLVCLILIEKSGSDAIDNVDKTE